MSPKTVVTTSWDDGHTLDTKLAELLKTYRLAGTFYIAPENREFAKDELLSNKQIATLDHDFEIGAHTMTHPRLSTIDDDMAQREIATSKHALESIVGHPVTSFCYPGGDYRAEHETMVREAGFSLARTVTRFATDIGTDPFAIPTTAHAYHHWSDLSLFPSRKYFDWSVLAIDLFDQVAANGGVFHLWGHSWEIEKNHDWDRLEKVFKHISNREGVRYAANRDLL